MFYFLTQFSNGEALNNFHHDHCSDSRGFDYIKLLAQCKIDGPNISVLQGSVRTLSHLTSVEFALVRGEQSLITPCKRHLSSPLGVMSRC